MARENTAHTAAATIAKIAKQHLDLDTLQEQKSDRLDFQEHAVWNIEAALRAAFLAGRDSAFAEQPSA